MNILSVDSLQSFIEIIESYPSDRYFYRGEQEKFKELTSSALRPYEYGWTSSKEYPFLNMLQEFYMETAQKLSEMQKSDFPAFAQHYGIPTNLLDVTSSPLIALFFACEDKTNNTGYMYLFDNDYIDITNLIHNRGHKTILNDLFIEDNEGILDFIPLFTEYSENFPKKFALCCRNLIKAYLNAFGDMDILFASELFLSLEAELRKPIYQIDPFSVASYISHIDKTIPSEKMKGCDIVVIAFLSLAKLFFILARSTGVQIPSFDFFPNFIYRPIMAFERGKSQNGFFFYQLYISYLNPEGDKRFLLSQKIQTTDIRFEIKNKEKIMRSLDNIGVNRKTIFRDFDSIASYIKDKYKV
ncbi:MAG: FRG domain-containing protein [Firmicutes bacterium]|nr:FRG domain-containing protein [Bacillota bacterium]